MVEFTSISNYADDTTFHACDSDLENLIRKLEHDAMLAVEWFENNYMKLNSDKCHFLISGFKHEILWARIGESKIRESQQQKLLGVTIDNNLKFNGHILSLCNKAGRKVSILSRMSRFLNFAQRKILMNSFIESQFAYCPLVWMFCSRKANNRINQIHERALRLVYNDTTSSFEELLIKDNSVTIHQKNIRSLAIEIFKIKNNLSTEIMSELLEARNIKYNLRSQTDFAIESVNTTNFGIESLSFFAPKIWNIIPNEIKSSKNLIQFKERIKTWIPDSCPCKLCCNYIQHVGFIDAI